MYTLYTDYSKMLNSIVLIDNINNNIIRIYNIISEY